MHKAPNLIAADIKEAIGDVDFLDKIDVQGAYLNFFVKKDIFVQRGSSLLRLARSNRYR